VARAERRRALRAGGRHRSLARSGRRPAHRDVSSRSAYQSLTARLRTGYNRDLDVIDEKQDHPEHSLTSILRRHHRDPDAFKRNVPTRKIGGRLALAPPHERELYRGPIRMLADVDGRPVVVEVTPSNDAQRLAIEAHDAATFAAVNHDDDTGLGRLSHRVVVDTQTGQRYRFYVDGDGIREAADTGEVELEDLFYSGGRRHDLDALLDREASA
jgi:hypothetical protein